MFQLGLRKVLADDLDVEQGHEIGLGVGDDEATAHGFRLAAASDSAAATRAIAPAEVVPAPSEARLGPTDRIRRPHEGEVRERLRGVAPVRAR